MPIAGQNIVIQRADLDGGINDVFEWSVSRRKNGGSWAVIGTYNLITAGHYTTPDSGVEGSAGTFSFAYPTEIPDDAVLDDTYEYRFEGADAWLGDDEVVRVTGEYVITEGISAAILSGGITTLTTVGII